MVNIPIRREDGRLTRYGRRRGLASYCRDMAEDTTEQPSSVHTTTGRPGIEEGLTPKVKKEGQEIGLKSMIGKTLKLDASDFN